MGKLIVFEGIDGTGKTTISSLLVTELKNRGINAVRYEDIENRNSVFNAAKEYIKAHATVEASFFFYVASALNKSAEITPLLTDAWVICDRYVYSTVAQHIARGLDAALVPDFKKTALRKPDYLFLLTVDEAVRISRLSLRGEASADDFVPKEVGSVPYIKEQTFMSFSPHVLDNSTDGPGLLIESICSIILESSTSSDSLS